MYLCNPNRGVEQQVARRAHNPKVTGSSPVPATSKHKASEKSEAFFILRVQHRYNNFTFL